MIGFKEVIHSDHLDHLRICVDRHFKVEISIDLQGITIIKGYPEDINQAESYIKMFLYAKPNYVTVECILIDLFKLSSFIFHVEKKYRASIMYIESDIFCIREEKEELSNLIKEMNAYVLDHRYFVDTNLKNDELKHKIEIACDGMNINFFEFKDLDDLVLKAFYEFFIVPKPSVLLNMPNNINTSQLQSDATYHSNNDSPSTSGARNYFIDESDPLVFKAAPDIIPNVLNTTVQPQYYEPILSKDTVTINPRTDNPLVTHQNNDPMHLEIPALPPNVDPNNLRYIVIDASNVAYEHGIQQGFSAKGILIAVQYFLNRGHREIMCLLPRYRQGQGYEIINELYDKGFLKFTPSRVVNNKRQTAYDDKMLLDLASQTNGVIVTNDQYRDIAKSDPKLKPIIDTRLINFVFVNDIFMIPDDPHGPAGPSLNELLQKSPPNRLVNIGAPNNRTKSPIQNKKKKGSSSKKKTEQTDTLDNDRNQESLRSALFNEIMDILGENYTTQILSVLDDYPHVYDTQVLVNMIMDNNDVN